MLLLYVDMYLLLEQNELSAIQMNWWFAVGQLFLGVWTVNFRLTAPMHAKVVMAVGKASHCAYLPGDTWFLGTTALGSFRCASLYEFKKHCPAEHCFSQVLSTN